MNLFNHAREKNIREEAPLAARMRPQTLDEYVGQEHILAPGRLLRRAIQADRVSSLIFYGPPGTGKTTLASVIANTTKSHFETLNAVLCGVPDIRRVVADAQERRSLYDKRTILFVDEVHRWNKAQQDALLPWVENGTVVLIGATTENPYFTVNRALVSRSRVFQLEPLDEGHLQQVIDHTLADSERGYGKLKVKLDDDAREHLVKVANGDARALLNALELAVETTTADDSGTITIDMAVAEESIQRRAVLYDKEGDYHFDTISAFIKSMRGSDPDATLYWMAKMVYAGEDPRFIFRRMLIFCGEDIGLADPNALAVCTAAADAFDRVGMPEGRYHLGMAALYLANAPKSNSVMGFFDALAAVGKEKDDEVPTHLRDGNRDKEAFGHGEGYLYPHAYRDHWVAQQYLPDSLQGKMFYQPGSVGHEKEIAETVQRRREAQLTAAIERDAGGAPPEILTFSPKDKALEQWLARTVGGVGERLGELRDAVFAQVNAARHATILDVSADGGLFTWEALRQTPEGGVWSLTSSKIAARALEERVEAMPELRRPHILSGHPRELHSLLAATDDADLRFDAIVGRNFLGPLAERATILKTLSKLLRPAGKLVFAEAVPARTQRLYQLIDAQIFDKNLFARLAEAEEEIYHNPQDPMVNWGEEDLRKAAAEANLHDISITPRELSVQQVLSASLLDRWFTPAPPGQRPSYSDHLATRLSKEEVQQVEREFRARLGAQSVPWNSTTLILSAQQG